MHIVGLCSGCCVSRGGVASPSQACKEFHIGKKNMRSSLQEWLRDAIFGHACGNCTLIIYYIHPHLTSSASLANYEVGQAKLF
jgi:hypothetical protein